MNAEVVVESIGSLEDLVAFLTKEGLVFLVGELMTEELEFIFECLATVLELAVEEGGFDFVGRITDGVSGRFQAL